MIKSRSTMVAGIVDNIRRVFHIVAEQSRKTEHETGLTGPQLWVVKTLEGASPMKVTELARRMYLHPATMVGLLDRLEIKGLVQRTRSDRDRRVVNVSISDRGREVIRDSPEGAQGLLMKGLEPLADRKVKTISEGLEQIVKILGVQEAPPKFIHSSDVNLPGKRRKNSA